MYMVDAGSSLDNEDDLLSLILSNLLRTIPLLNCLKIYANSTLDWNQLNSSLTPAFLHLMRLPTINHLDLSFIMNFPLSSLISSVNLRRLDISDLSHFDPHGKDSFYETVQTEMMPKIREFHISESSHKTTMIFVSQDGRPAFNFMDLR